VNYEIVQLEEFIGPKATIYSILPQGENETLFDLFVREHYKDYSMEIEDIFHTLEMMQINKAKRVSSPLIKNILEVANPLQKIQNNNRIALACRIDDLMKANGYSNSTFAKKLGKQPSVITKWLSGTHNFTMDTLDEIAYHLGVESVHLLQPQQTQTIYQKTIQVVTKIAEEDLKYNCNSAENNAFNQLNPNHGQDNNG